MLRYGAPAVLIPLALAPNSLAGGVNLTTVPYISVGVGWGGLTIAPNTGIDAEVLGYSGPEVSVGSRTALSCGSLSAAAQLDVVNICQVAGDTNLLCISAAASAGWRLSSVTLGAGWQYARSMASLSDYKTDRTCHSVSGGLLGGRCQWRRLSVDFAAALVRRTGLRPELQMLVAIEAAGRFGCVSPHAGLGWIVHQRDHGSPFSESPLDASTIVSVGVQLSPRVHISSLLARLSAPKSIQVLS